MISLKEARAALRARMLAGEVSKCPCCTQTVKMYRRQIHANMARSLIQMYRRHGFEWNQPAKWNPTRARDEAMLAYWGLIEQAGEERADGGNAGWWRVTPRGEKFVLGKTRVPKYAKVYNGKVREYEGERRSIADALGTKFDYNELMSR